MDGAGCSLDDKRGMGLKIENPCAGDTLENGSWPGWWCDWRSSSTDHKVVIDGFADD